VPSGVEVDESLNGMESSAGSPKFPTAEHRHQDRRFVTVQGHALFKVLWASRVELVEPLADERVPSNGRP
jgi:hypothetical protein